MRSRKHWHGASLARSSRPPPGSCSCTPRVGDRPVRVYDGRPHLPVPAAGADAALVRSGVRAFGHLQAMRLSLLVASVATLLAIVLGTLAAFAMARRSFPGKESITLLFVLPIALPGIITASHCSPASGPSAFEPGFWTIVAGHGDVLPRHRLQQRSGAAAAHSAELGRGLDGPRRRRLADVPPGAAAADRHGAARRAACSRSPSSFDEIIVTLFTAVTSRPCRSGSTANCSVRASGQSPTSSPWS